MPALRPNDMAGLVTFSAEPKVEIDTTTDISAVVNKLNTIQSMGGSAIYDALLKAIEMATEEKLSAYRKFIVMFTDGDDKNSISSLQHVVDVAKTTLSDYNINLYLIGISREGLSYSDLKKIAQAGNGVFKEAPLGEIDELFQSIYSNL